MPVRGKQIAQAVSALLPASELVSPAAGTVGDFLKNNVQRTVRYPAIVATLDAAKATNSTLAHKPLSLPVINVNGGDSSGVVGDGVKTGAFYFSADSGATARTLANMAAGDSLYVNPTVLGYPLDTDDVLIVSYRAYPAA
ncbi:hypothetical protein [Spirosoma sordidisoli]|uniref:Uncharacterized protein n=1 Tax=Spirosoma sordidisoli TaxID=2502893 RepID=A0A4Q2US23_9BACT|nr:hypothetical protein [Spirosoma sordidisoli]RYC69629.1 hypothetical protein EQG79_13595 [Spirosoma sordidisoli]